MVKIKSNNLQLQSDNWNLENLGYLPCSVIKSLYRCGKLSGLSLSNGLCQSEDKYSINQSARGPRYILNYNCSQQFHVCKVTLKIYPWIRKKLRRNTQIL